jgi:hypothetical protein
MYNRGMDIQNVTIKASRIVVVPGSDFGRFRIIAFQFQRDCVEALKELERTGQAAEIDLYEPDNGTHTAVPRIVTDVSIPNEYPRYGNGPTDVLIVDVRNR